MFFRRLIAFAALAAAVCSCGVLTDQVTPEEEAMIKERLDAQSFKVDIEFMNPRRGPQQALTTPYVVIINDGQINSALPYIGQAWNLPYGGGKGFNFEAPIVDYAQKLAAFGGARIIEVTTDNEEELLLYRFEIYPNGKVHLTVRSQHREVIDYSGHLDPYTNPAEKKK